MYKLLTAYLLYLILELQASAGIVEAAQDEPLTIYIDSGKEMETALKTINSYDSKQKDMEQILFRVQKLMESMEERLVKLESDFQNSTDDQQDDQSSETALESRLTDVENELKITKAREMSDQSSRAVLESRLTDMKNELIATEVREMSNFQLLLGKFNEMERKLEFSYNVEKVEDKQMNVYTDCADVKMKLGARYVDGVYEINVPNLPPIEVNCITKCLRDCCAWTMIMHGSVASADRVYQRDFDEYQNGFGRADGDHFIGLDRLNVLTYRSPQIFLIKDYMTGQAIMFPGTRIANALFSYAVSGVNRKFSTNSKCALTRGRSWWYDEQCVGSFGIDTLSPNIYMMMRPGQCSDNQ